MAVFKGYKGATQTSSSFSWNKTEGWQSRVVYEGSHATIRGIAGNVTLWADEIQIDSDNATSRLTATVGRDVTGAADNAAVDITTTWDLNSNEVQRDLREADAVRSLSDNQITDVERAAAKAKASTETANASTFIGSGWNASQKNLFWFFLRDQYNWLDFEFALTKRELVSSLYTVGVSMAGVGKLWTSGQIEAAEGALPTAMAASITAIASNTTPSNNNSQMADGSNYWRYRWLKKAPNITQTTGGKFERTTEYWLGLWPTWLYPTYS